MFAAIIPQLLPIIADVLGKTITDTNEKNRLVGDLQNAFIEKASSIEIETIKTNQIEAGHRSIWVAGWRPAIGWSLALGIFWLLVGFPIASWIIAVQGLDVVLPELPTDILFELTMAMLGMGAIRSFDKLKNLTK